MAAAPVTEQPSENLEEVSQVVWIYATYEARNADFGLQTGGGFNLTSPSAAASLGRSNQLLSFVRRPNFTAVVGTQAGRRRGIARR
jgi:hypothetical protein